VRRAYKFLIRPTAGQQRALTAALDDHRALYNAALQERRDAYRKAKVSIRYGDQSAQLKDIRRADPDGQGRWSFSSQQATLRRLDKAFQAFFRRVKAGQAPGVDNPRHGRRNAGRLAAAQQALARRERGSNRRRKARERVAALHTKVRRRRLDHAHKTARWLVEHYDVIACEALRIGNMTRSASGTFEQPGTNVAQKSGLNSSILDAGWGGSSMFCEPRLKAPDA
jgi:putative transposase